MMKRLTIVMILLMAVCFSAGAENTQYAWQGDVCVFEEDGALGLMNASGSVVLEAAYNEIEPFGDDDYAIVRQGAKKGVVRRDGTFAVECIWDAAVLYPGERFAVCYDDFAHQTLYDLETGAILLTGGEKTAYSAWNGYIYALTYGDIGWPFQPPYHTDVYDGNGNLIFGTDGYFVREFSDGIAVVQRDDSTYDVIDEQGNVRVKGMERNPLVKDGRVYYAGEADGEQRCLVISAQDILEAQGISIEGPDGEGLYAVQVSGYQYMDDEENRFGYVDGSGAMVIEPVFRRAYGFVDGAAVVKQDGLYHLIDRSGSQIGELTWTWAPDMEGEAVMEQPVIPIGMNDGYRLIDRRGEYVIDEVFAEAGMTFADEYLILKDADGNTCLADGAGAIVYRGAIEDWMIFAGEENGRCLFGKTEGLWRCVFIDGEEELPGAVFADAYPYSDGCLLATLRDGSRVYEDLQGNVYAPIF